MNRDFHIVAPVGVLPIDGVSVGIVLAEADGTKLYRRISIQDLRTLASTAAGYEGTAGVAPVCAEGWTDHLVPYATQSDRSSDSPNAAEFPQLGGVVLPAANASTAD